MADSTVQRPPPLPPGARIAVSCPASPPDPGKLERGVDLLRRLGFEVIRGATCGAPKGALHAGDDAARATELIGFLEDPRIDAIFAGRGGVGCMRLLPHLRPLFDRRGGDPPPLRPKWIVGRSDLSSLHLSFLRHLRWVGLSGPMVATDLGADSPVESVVETTLRLMRDPTPPGRLETPLPLETWVAGEGFAEGPLLPVNLSLLSSLVGTPHLPSLEGTIVVLEEIDEPPHRCDRMLTQLRLSGLLGGLAGLVFGQFTACHPRGEGMPEDLLVRLLQDHASGIGVPAIAGFPYGHEPLFHPLPVGVRARIECGPGKAPALILLESASDAGEAHQAVPA